MQFLHGTIVFRQADQKQRSMLYELVANFSHGVGQKVDTGALEALQQDKLFRGNLTVERLDEGDMRIRHDIVAYGPESACKRARDLQAKLSEFLGLTFNIACPT